MLPILGVSSRLICRSGPRWINQKPFSVCAAVTSYPKLLQQNEKIIKTCLPAIGPYNVRQFSPEASHIKENFWDKNDRLKRPISPHLAIYQPQITWMISLAHRTTGLLLTVGTTGFALGTLALSHPLASYVAAFSEFLVANHVEILGYMIKFAIAYPFVLHTFTGVRHLMWDMGKGFDMRTTYQTGYGALILSVILTALIAAIKTNFEPVTSEQEKNRTV